MLISNAYAQAAAGAQPSLGMMDIALPIVMVVAVYFLMFRPQMKKQKEHRAMIEALAKGDEVVTAGGLLAKVTKLGEGYISAEIASGVEIQLQRSAVVQVLPKGTIK